MAKVLEKKSFFENFSKNIWRIKKLALPLHSLFGSNNTTKSRKVLKKKFFENFFQKIWRFEKLDLPLQPISAKNLRNDKRGNLEKLR